jgi:type I restriction enzyme S subunit
LKRYTISSDDVYISIAGTVGVVGIVPNALESANLTENAAKIVIKDNDVVDKLYLTAYLSSSLGQHQIELRTTKTSQPKLALTRIRQIPVPLPPLPEQRAIAHALSIVRAAIEATDRVIAAARELKRSLMKHLFTHGPVPVNEAENVLLKETEIGDIPKEWDVAGFGGLVDIKSGQVDPREEPYWNMIHIGPENIEEATGRILSPRTAAELKLKSGKYLFTPEDVIYSKIRPYLRKAALPEFAGICSADMYPVHPKNDGLLREYLYHYLLSDKFTRQAISHQARTGIPKINRVQLNSTIIPIPNRSVQKKIATILSVIDEKLEADLNRSTTLEELFNSLLHHLMTGKLRVPITEVMEHKIKL